MEEKDNCEKEKKKRWKASTSRQHMQNIFFVDSGVGVVAAEAPGGGSDGIPEEEEDLEMYMSDKDLCIRCNKGGRLFVCRDSCCPIAVHKECMPDALSIGDMDNFYCPYCTYRRAFRKTNETSKLVKETKKVLSCFLIKSSPTVNSQMLKVPEGGVSRPIILGETNSDRIAKQLNATDVHAGQLENDQVVERANKIVDEQQEKEEQNIPLVVEDAQLKNSVDSSRKRRCEDNDDVIIQEKNRQKKKPSRRIKSSSSSSDVQVRIMEQKVKNPTSSKDKSTAVEHKDENVCLQNLKLSPRDVKVEQKEISNTNSSEFKPQLLLGRKKCRWSSEEEEMLKKGVEKYSTKINKNIPWRKLLEFGREVFHSSRNSSDLKDKWRNMLARQQT